MSIAVHDHEKLLSGMTPQMAAAFENEVYKGSGEKCGYITDIMQGPQISVRQGGPKGAMGHCMSESTFSVSKACSSTGTSTGCFQGRLSECQIGTVPTSRGRQFPMGRPQMGAERPSEALSGDHRVVSIVVVCGKRGN